MSNKHHQQEQPWQIDPQKYKEAADALFHRQPKLSPRLDKWAEDMPGIRETQFAEPRLIRVNEINDTWMEIPRYENIMWGGGWVAAIIILMIFIVFFNFMPVFFSKGIIASGKLFFVMLLFCSVFILFLVSALILNLRILLSAPRGTPFRLNRTRQKIYIYDYQRSKWNPWVRWPTIIKVFDWADIHGEMTREVDRYDQGYRLYGAVCYPGTHQVRERFILSYSVGDPGLLHGLWSHCCQYMQGKAVPPYPLVTERPNTWALWETVRWPEDMDRESRTAPGEKEMKREVR